MYAHFLTIAIYVASTNQHIIRKISNGVVTTIAGILASPGVIDGPGVQASFNYPFGLAIDSQNSLYVGEFGSTRVRKINSTGYTSTYAGSSTGYTNANGTAAQFSSIYGVACDAFSNIYVSDSSSNELIRMIAPVGQVVSTIAGTLGVQGATNGIRSAYLSDLL